VGRSQTCAVVSCKLHVDIFLVAHSAPGRFWLRVRKLVSARCSRATCTLCVHAQSRRTRTHAQDNDRLEHDFCVRTNADRVAWLGYLKHLIQVRVCCAGAHDV
jgi:hypothetical protein